MIQPVFKTENAVVYCGNNLDILPQLQTNSIDAIVCDPPYELGFMGKAWDASGIAYSVELWQECLRVLKPGGHLLAFSGSRTYHRMVVAIEDAGFEIRDMVSWISNKTFPKSLNISKAITKKLDDKTPADKWNGWGTGLKPTVEPIVLARKPIEKTVAENVLTYGVGGLNIDATRIGTEIITTTKGKGFAGSFEGGVNNNGGNQHLGRHPANLIIDEYTAELLDEQSGQIKGGTWNNTAGARHFNNDGKPTDYVSKGVDNSVGGASRFFYVARASQKDKNEGLDHLEARINLKWNGSEGHRGIGDFYPDGSPRKINPMKNFHPTVKPTALMQYLIRLVTPSNGIVLDPFAGSGSTGKAAILENKQFIGIEITAEYLPIIQGRIEHAEQQLLDKAGDLFE